MAATPPSGRVDSRKSASTQEVEFLTRDAPPRDPRRPVSVLSRGSGRPREVHRRRRPEMGTGAAAHDRLRPPRETGCDGGRPRHEGAVPADRRRGALRRDAARAASRVDPSGVARLSVPGRESSPGFRLATIFFYGRRRPLPRPPPGRRGARRRTRLFSACRASSIPGPRRGPPAATRLGLWRARPGRNPGYRRRRRRSPRRPSMPGR